MTIGMPRFLFLTLTATGLCQTGFHHLKIHSTTRPHMPGRASPDGTLHPEDKTLDRIDLRP
ncbi:MAG TPA: hypothetical protein PLA65_18295 [Spirochaetota bacterium]|nr:hypothetical protein [Spirochaetota bacterium]HOD15748.1 hypothetical protein [Spirochaetota bacterium]HPG50082.1 hypothetical protein [Spirochaetota bacterium]HPN14016.1 hypothetical protein [Spirochaetota bacterium]